MKAHHFREKKIYSPSSKDQPSSKHWKEKKKKEKVQHKLNKSLEQGLNLSGS